MSMTLSRLRAHLISSSASWKLGCIGRDRRLTRSAAAAVSEAQHGADRAHGQRTRDGHVEKRNPRELGALRSLARRAHDRRAERPHFLEVHSCRNHLLRRRAEQSKDSDTQNHTSTQTHKNHSHKHARRTDARAQTFCRTLMHAQHSHAHQSAFTRTERCARKSSSTNAFVRMQSRTSTRTVFHATTDDAQRLRC